jgi:hypothetical protein
MITCNEPSCGERGNPFTLFFDQTGRHTDLCPAHAEPLLRIASLGERIDFPFVRGGMNPAQFYYLCMHERDEEYRKLGL